VLWRNPWDHYLICLSLGMLFNTTLTIAILYRVTAPDSFHPALDALGEPEALTFNIHLDPEQRIH
jgi:hypothetical protein